MQKCTHFVELEKCCQTHILNYFLAKFRFDRAENEPAKHLQSLQQKPACGPAARRCARTAGCRTRRPRPRAEHLATLAGCATLPGGRISKISKFCKFLAGSFSALSKRNFARKYAFDSIFQALQDLHTFAPLQS